VKNVCPHCEADLRGEPISPEHFTHKDEYKDGKYETCSGDNNCFPCFPYGWKEPEDRFYSKVIGIEQPGVYDGVLYWLCPECGKAWQRWTDPKMELHRRAQRFIDEINEARDAEAATES
jgi:hypothetical protein